MVNDGLNRFGKADLRQGNIYNDKLIRTGFKIQYRATQLSQNECFKSEVGQWVNFMKILKIPMRVLKT